MGSLQKSIIKLSGIVLLLAVLIACGSNTSDKPVVNKNPIPAWYENRKTVYPESQFLAEIGSGSTRRAAENDAAGALARLFKVEITVVSEANQQFRFSSGANGTSASERSSVSQSVTSSAQETLRGIAFSEAYLDKNGRTNIVAYIERSKAALIYKDLLNTALKSMQKYQERITQASTELQRFSLYNAWWNQSLDAEALLGQLEIIHRPTAQQFSGQIDTAAVAALRDKSQERLVYRPEIRGDTSGQIAGAARDELLRLGIKESPNATMRLSGLWSAEAVTLNSTFKSVRWVLQLSLIDEDGTTIASISREDRDNGGTIDQAKAFGVLAAKKQIQEGLVSSLRNYLAKAVSPSKP